MLTFLPAPVLGTLMLVLLTVHTVLWASAIYAVVLVKLVLPVPRVRIAMSRLAAALAQRWAFLNTCYVKWFLRVEWDIRILTELSPERSYLACVNHQSWNDIFVLMQAFGLRAPFFKFFLKQELIWVPVLGLAWWGLDYPFMKRYTSEQIARNPALKGTDLATTRKACEKYRGQPVLIVNFLEGTRFTPAKHAKQESPYRHLLRAKAGGYAFALSALGDVLDGLLDVTIVYPDGARGFFDLLSGKVRRVAVEIRAIERPAGLVGDYENDPEFRKRFQGWIGQLWADKDRRIGEALERAGPSRVR